MKQPKWYFTNSRFELPHEVGGKLPTNATDYTPGMKHFSSVLSRTRDRPTSSSLCPLPFLCPLPQNPSCRPFPRPARAVRAARAARAPARVALLARAARLARGARAKRPRAQPAREEVREVLGGAAQEAAGAAREAAGVMPASLVFRNRYNFFARFLLWLLVNSIAAECMYASQLDNLSCHVCFKILLHIIGIKKNERI
jgi:hypothetical protein